MKTLKSNKYDYKTQNSDGNRILRLLGMLQEIRNNPAQSLENVLKQFGISRSQFYKDRGTLASLGFSFEYRKGRGFKIMEDRLTPLVGLSLSDRVTLLFALENLSASGDGVLAAKAIEIGRKLAGGLESPFREQLLECFDSEITQKAYGVNPAIFASLTDAIKDYRRIRILYRSSHDDWKESWRLIDPKRVYMRLRVLYLYARSLDDTPPTWKVYRLSRIQKIEPTGITFTPNPDENDGFCERQKNAFIAFLGDKPRKITIRFMGKAIPYIKEQLWHSSQVLEEQSDGSLLFTVTVAEPEEVARWSQQFGKNAIVEEIERKNEIIP